MADALNVKHIFLVKSVCGLSYEGSWETTVHSGFDKDEAIEFAKSHYQTIEADLVLHYDYGRVIVEQISVGRVDGAIRVWDSQTALEFVPIGEIRQQAVVPTFSLLWDEKIPSDIDLNKDYTYLCDRTLVARNASAEHAAVSYTKANVANDMAWDLFERYEKNVA